MVDALFCGGSLIGRERKIDMPDQVVKQAIDDPRFSLERIARNKSNGFNNSVNQQRRQYGNAVADFLNPILSSQMSPGSTQFSERSVQEAQAQVPKFKPMPQFEQMKQQSAQAQMQTQLQPYQNTQQQFADYARQQEMQRQNELANVFGGAFGTPQPAQNQQSLDYARAQQIQSNNAAMNLAAQQQQQMAQQQAAQENARVAAEQQQRVQQQEQIRSQIAQLQAQIQALQSQLQ